MDRMPRPCVNVVAVLAVAVLLSAAVLVLLAP